jgi:hypothetical protein
MPTLLLCVMQLHPFKLQWFKPENPIYTVKENTYIFKKLETVVSDPLSQKA